MKKILLWAVLIIIVLIFGLLVYSGLFVSVDVSEKIMGPYTLVYEPYVGDYKNTGKIADKVYQALLKDKIETIRGFGIYYDDPKTTAKEKRRSDIGCILEKRDNARIGMIKKPLKVKVYNKKKCMVAEFPFRTYLSIILGITKVYPEFEKYMQGKKYKGAPVMEIYDMSSKKIIYLMPITK